MDLDVTINHTEEKAHDYPYPFVRWTEQRNIEAFLSLMGRKKVCVERLISIGFQFTTHFRHTLCSRVNSDTSVLS